MKNIRKLTHYNHENTSLFTDLFRYVVDTVAIVFDVVFSSSLSSGGSDGSEGGGTSKSDSNSDIFSHLKILLCTICLFVVQQRNNCIFYTHKTHQTHNMYQYTFHTLRSMLYVYNVNSDYLSALPSNLRTCHCFCFIFDRHFCCRAQAFRLWVCVCVCACDSLQRMKMETRSWCDIETFSRTIFRRRHCLYRRTRHHIQNDENKFMFYTACFSVVPVAVCSVTIFSREAWILNSKFICHRFNAPLKYAQLHSTNENLPNFAVASIS